MRKFYVAFHPFTAFEKWIIDIDKQQKLLSRLYNLLLSLKPVTDVARRQWMSYLNIAIFKWVWEEISTFNYKFSLYIAIKEKIDIQSFIGSI